MNFFGEVLIFKRIKNIKRVIFYFYGEVYNVAKSAYFRGRNTKKG